MKISVIVNSYKGTEVYLEECLNSIRAQTFRPFEVIVVEDGYEKPMIYPDTKTILRDKNIGVAKSRDEGFRLSVGDYVLFVDADDVLPENFIGEMAAQVRWKKSDITYPSAVIWSRWGDSQLENATFSPPSPLTLKHMSIQNFVLVTSLIKREVYEDIGGFSPELPIFEDYEFFLKAMVKGYKFSKANCFLKYRQRTQSRNRSNDSIKEEVYNHIRESVLGVKKVVSKPRRSNVPIR